MVSNLFRSANACTFTVDFHLEYTNVAQKATCHSKEIEWLALVLVTYEAVSIFSLDLVEN